MAEIKVGEETTEFKVLKWGGGVALLFISIMTTLTAMGVTPQEGLWATILGGAYTLARMYAAYAESRGAIKSADALAKAHVEVGTSPLASKEE